MIKHSGFTGLVGVARADITPPVGIFCRNWGAAKHDAAEGIHRPLLLTVLTLQTGPQSPPLVLVDVDNCCWSSKTCSQNSRKRVLAELKLSDEQYILGFSHTHSSPPLTEPEPQWKGGELLPPYIERLTATIIATARQALAAAKPATLEWHPGRCALAANRDLPEGKRIACGFNPDKPADDTVVVGRVADATGKVLATVVNYACHPTTLAWDNKMVSPDFVGMMRETLEQANGGAPALFLQGASGEMAPRYQYVGDTTVADEHGRELGYAALATLSAMEPVGQELVYDRVVESGAPLAVWKRQPRAVSKQLRPIRRLVELPLKDFPLAAELQKQYEAATDRALKERLRRKLRLRQALGDGKTLGLEVWGWRVGDSVIVGATAEPYVCFQQNLRARFPGHAILWMNVVHGSLGYLAPAALYDSDIYQVWQSPFERGSLELLESATADLIEELLRDAD